jgi:outer membrane receptor protein involved in Fe transport
MTLTTDALGRLRPAQRSLVALAVACTLVPAGAANGQQAAQAPENVIGEIVVTAQKREESVTSVPMSITAVTGDQLEQAGIRDVSDLVKVTPGLTFGKSTNGTPVYTLRGVGYNDISMTARPTVTVYVDEAPVPFSLEARGAALDVARVEVLKGPQGTLFGNNSTGGAVNYVTNKPGDEFAAGGTVELGRFNSVYVSGYVSGPLSETVGARLAIEHRGGGEWQKNYVNGEKVGKQDFTNARVILAWKPTDSVRTQLTISRWTDRGDTQAAQAVGLRSQIPGLFPLTGLTGFTVAPPDARAASWNPGLDWSKDDKFTHVAGRIDYDLTPQLTITSLTHYMKFDQYAPYDTDGSPVSNVQITFRGNVKTYGEELRLAGTYDKTRFIVGAVYARDEAFEDNLTDFSSSTVGISFEGLTGGTRFGESTLFAEQTMKNTAAFANVEYDVSDLITLQAGARYTKMKNSYFGCTRDSGDGTAAIVFNALSNVLRGGAPPAANAQPGDCVTFDANILPGPFIDNLDQSNVSWRVGVQFKPSDSTLFYGNVSKGFKAGGYASLTALTQPGLAPAVQEALLAYEVGFKSTLNPTLQLNGAVFYYDYTDKQVTGTSVDPVVGTRSQLVNVPKAAISGAELQLIAAPLEGLTLNAGVSYLDSKVRDHYTSFNSIGDIQDFDGTKLPFVPEWQLTGTARYAHPVTQNVDAFVSSTVTYQSKSYGSLGEIQTTYLPPYALTDAQVGIERNDGSWRAFLWGRNIFDKYYWTASNRLVDTFGRFAGQPATYGVAFTGRF